MILAMKGINNLVKSYRMSDLGKHRIIKSNSLILSTCNQLFSTGPYKYLHFTYKSNLSDLNS